MNEKRIECPLCRTGTYPHFGYTGSGVCDHCGAEWTYDETDTLTDNAMRALWEKIPRWIPVGQSLPESGKPVLCVDDFDGWCEVLQHEGLAGWVDIRGNKAYATPTHWMPLPAPPQSDE